ncbi:MAG: restriction endonuclease subunit S, partial [Deltaproteobacteria bacterium]|nr:restriction endonuclease subunit S [Deltaproteobacteria bacterium]
MSDIEVKTGWVVETTEDFCIKVADGTHDSPQRVDIGKPLVTSKNIIGGRLDLSNTYNISVNDFIAINKRSAVHKNDVLLSMIGTVGEACLIEEEPNFAIKNVGLLKNDDEYKAKWLYFYLRSSKAQQLIKERLRGTTQQYLPLGEIRKFPVPYPQAQHELEWIVDNLWTLHSKIELNRQINQTLEAMAQAIFKSWFVDFDPVKAKIAALESGEDAEGVTRAAMRAISGKTDDELDIMEGGQPEDYAKLKTTAELFPAAMQDSELGKVPEGWEVKLSGEIMDVRDGTHDSPKKSDK